MLTYNRCVTIFVTKTKTVGKSCSKGSVSYLPELPSRAYLRPFRAYFEQLIPTCGVVRINVVSCLPVLFALILWLFPFLQRLADR
eukprot:3484630-Amphidinium_carterae.1